MTLRTLVSQCKDVPDGQGVSYGLRYHTSGPSTLALIPLGYADGVPRVATGGPVRVAGRTYPVVGRIAMDQMVIDLGDIGPAGADLFGAEAVLFGNGADGGPTADDWARAAGTNNYEIVTRISPRVPRRFINEGPAVGHRCRASTQHRASDEGHAVSVPAQAELPAWEQTLRVTTADQTHALGAALGGGAAGRGPAGADRRAGCREDHVHPGAGRRPGRARGHHFAHVRPGPHPPQPA